jgi:hypothetical protein
MFLILCSTHVTLGLITVAVYNQLRYMIWMQQASPLAHMFQSPSLLHGCAVYTENVKFSFLLPLPYCPHKLHRCLRCEIQCVFKMTKGLCYSNASYIRQSSLCYSLSPLFISRYTYTQLSKGRSLTVLSAWQHKQRQRQRSRFFQCRNMYVHICVRWFGCLYILRFHMQT